MIFYDCHLKYFSLKNPIIIFLFSILTTPKMKKKKKKKKKEKDNERRNTLTMKFSSDGNITKK
jgi:hypothetical protein